MTRHSTLVVAALLAGLLAGCGGHGTVVPGHSTRQDVQATWGNPTETRRDPGGDELLDYVRGPEGFETWRVRIGADGRVKEATQLLTQERLMSVAPGKSTRQEVRHLLGRPSEEMMTGAGEVWAWRYLLNGLAGHLIVSFNANGIARERGVLIDMTNSDPAD